MQTFQRKKNDHCQSQSRDHLAEEVHDQLDSHEVGDAEGHGQKRVRVQRFRDGRGEAFQRGGDRNDMSEDSSQEEKMQFVVMFTPSSKAKAQHAF